MYCRFYRANAFKSCYLLIIKLLQNENCMLNQNYSLLTVKML
jgi:hypothetical protein